MALKTSMYGFFILKNKSLFLTGEEALSIMEYPSLEKEKK